MCWLWRKTSGEAVVLADEVVLQPLLEYAGMYADDLSTIIGEFHPDVVGYALPGQRHHLWHTFQRVLTVDAWGWVSVDCLLLRGGEGSR